MTSEGNIPKYPHLHVLLKLLSLLLRVRVLLINLVTLVILAVRRPGDVLRRLSPIRLSGIVVELVLEMARGRRG